MQNKIAILVIYLKKNILLAPYRYRNRKFGPLFLTRGVFLSVLQHFEELKD